MCKITNKELDIVKPLLYKYWLNVERVPDPSCVVPLGTCLVCMLSGDQVTTAGLDFFCIDWYVV